MGPITLENLGHHKVRWIGTVHLLTDGNHLKGQPVEFEERRVRRGYINDDKLNCLDFWTSDLLIFHIG